MDPEKKKKKKGPTQCPCRNREKSIATEFSIYVLLSLSCLKFYVVIVFCVVPLKLCHDLEKFVATEFCAASSMCCHDL